MVVNDHIVVIDYLTRIIKPHFKVTSEIVTLNLHYAPTLLFGESLAALNSAGLIGGLEAKELPISFH